MRLAFALMALGFVSLLGACGSEDDFDTRFERERQAIEQQGAQIENRVANDMEAAREAQRAMAETSTEEQAE